MFRAKSRFFFFANLLNSNRGLSSGCRPSFMSHGSDVLEGRPPLSVLGEKVLVEHKIFVNKSCSNFFDVKTHGLSVHLKPSELEFKAYVLSEEAQSQLRCNVDVNFEVNDNRISVFASNERESGRGVKPTLQLQIPHQSVVDIQTTSGDVTMDPIELLEVTCRLRRASFTANKLKCSCLRVDNFASGDVNLEGSFVGKLYIKLRGDGSMRGDLLRCSDVSVTTEDGMIDVATVYASSVAIASLSGDVRLRTIRSQCEIALQRGHLSIGCLDGALVANVKSGNAAVFMNNLDRDSHSSIVCERGDMQLAISSQLSVNLHLEGRELDVRTLNGAARTVCENIKLYQGSVTKHDLMPNCDISAVATTGTLTVHVKDWFETVTAANWK